MATASILINQSGKSAGLPSTSREDLDLNLTVTLTNNDDTGAAGWLWEFVAKPPTSSATLADYDTNTATFTPDVVGSYLIKLTVYDGVNEVIDQRVAAVTTSQYEMRIPAATETDEFNGTTGWSNAIYYAFTNLDGYAQKLGDSLRLDEVLSDPTYGDSYGWVYSKEIDGYTELFYQDSYGNSVQISSGGSVVGNGSLDTAYDSGGTGSGRLITADGGAVKIDLPDGASDAAFHIENNDTGGNYSIWLDGYSYKTIAADALLFCGSVSSGTTDSITSFGAQQLGTGDASAYIYAVAASGVGDVYVGHPTFLSDIYIGRYTGTSSATATTINIGGGSSNPTTINIVSSDYSSTYGNVNIQSVLGTINVTSGSNTTVYATDELKLQYHSTTGSFYIQDGTDNMAHFSDVGEITLSPRPGQNFNISTSSGADINLDGYLKIDSGHRDEASWVQTYMAFSSSAADWIDFKSNFGEASLLGALNQAFGDNTDEPIFAKSGQFTQTVSASSNETGSVYLGLSKGAVYATRIEILSGTSADVDLELGDSSFSGSPTTLYQIGEDALGVTLWDPSADGDWLDRNMWGFYGLTDGYMYWRLTNDGASEIQLRVTLLSVGTDGQSLAGLSGASITTEFLTSSLTLTDGYDFVLAESRYKTISGIAARINVVPNIYSGQLTIEIYQDYSRQVKVAEHIVDLSDSNTYNCYVPFGFDNDVVGRLYGTVYTSGVADGYVANVSVFAHVLAPADEPSVLDSPYGDGIEADLFGLPQVALHSASGLNFDVYGNLQIKPDVGADAYVSLSSNGVAVTGVVDLTTNQVVGGEKKFESIGFSPLDGYGAPTTGEWTVGTEILDGYNIKWRCVTSGIPGYWELADTITQETDVVVSESLADGYNELLQIPVTGNTGQALWLRVWARRESGTTEMEVPFRVRMYETTNKRGRELIWQGRGTARQTYLTSSLPPSQIYLEVNDNSIADVDEMLCVYEDDDRFELGRCVGRLSGNFDVSEALTDPDTWNINTLVVAVTEWFSVPWHNTDGNPDNQNQILVEVRHDGTETDPAIVFYVQALAQSRGSIR